MTDNTEREIALEIEAENERLELEKIKPLPINRNPVKEAKLAWMVGTIALDIATAYYIWQTTLLFYGILWILIGAGGLIWSERQRERIGNNDQQKAIGRHGVNVSAIAVFVMALGMGIVYLIGLTQVRAVMITVEVLTVGLFGYHLYQAYRYHDLDDEYQEQNADSLAEASNVYQLRQIHRAARRVEGKKRKNIIRDNYRGKHGEAFDAAYKQVDPNRQNGNQQGNKQNNAPRPAYAGDAEQVRLSPPNNGSHEPDFTQGGSKR